MGELRYKVLLAAVLALCLGGQLRADCDTPPNSGWGAGYSAYAAWCRACGGTPYNDSGIGCRPGSNWGGAPPPASHRAEQEQESLALEAARQKKAARKKELEEAEKKKKEEEEKEFRRRQAEGAKNLKGVPRGGGGLKGAGAAPAQLKGVGDACARDSDFQSYRSREEERRHYLKNLRDNLAAGRAEKYRGDWCRLNIPLPPSPQASGYCEKKPVYLARMEEWRLKCSAVAAPVAPARNDGTEKPAPRGDAADCLGVYDGEVKPCAAEGLRAAACINKAVFSYLRCLTGETPRVGSGN